MRLTVVDANILHFFIYNKVIYQLKRLTILQILAIKAQSWHEYIYFSGAWRTNPLKPTTFMLNREWTQTGITGLCICYWQYFSPTTFLMTQSYKLNLGRVRLKSNLSTRTTRQPPTPPFKVKLLFQCRTVMAHAEMWCPVVVMEVLKNGEEVNCYFSLNSQAESQPEGVIRRSSQDDDSSPLST